MADKSNITGDDQGTKIGSPRRNDGAGATGAGGEAAEGIHAASGGRDPGANSSLESHPTGRGDAQSGSGKQSAGGAASGSERTGSEPLVDRGTEHRSGYGGKAGQPVSSTDQREGTGRTARDQ